MHTVRAKWMRGARWKKEDIIRMPVARDWPFRASSCHDIMVISGRNSSLMNIPTRKTTRWCEIKSVCVRSHPHTDDLNFTALYFSDNAVGWISRREESIGGCCALDARLCGLVANHFPKNARENISELPAEGYVPTRSFASPHSRINNDIIPSGATAGEVINRNIIRVRWKRLF